MPRGIEHLALETPDLVEQAREQVAGHAAVTRSSRSHGAFERARGGLAAAQERTRACFHGSEQSRIVEARRDDDDPWAVGALERANDARCLVVDLVDHDHGDLGRVGVGPTHDAQAGASGELGCDAGLEDGIGCVHEHGRAICHDASLEVRAPPALNVRST